MTARRGLQVAVYPKDANPYQEHLYAAMRDEGVAVRYLGELTPSHTVNLLLLPAEVVASRLRGCGVVHLHWVFGFRFPGAGRSRAVGRLSYRWYRLFLRTVAAGGGRLVWTAHNVLPHTPVFPDDVAARRELVRRADLVIAHSEATLESLAALGIEPRAAAVVPHGPFGEVRPPARPRASRPADQPLTLLFAGVVDEYKGVVDLLEAFAALEGPKARLVVAGACPDAGYRERVLRAAATAGSAVETRLHRLTDEELQAALDEADVLVLPYREVTTSGSALLGLGAALPLVVPDLPGLAELPDAAVLRYPAPEGLTGALRQVVRMPRQRLAELGEAGYAFSRLHSWAEIARTTVALLGRLGEAGPPVRSGRA